MTNHWDVGESDLDYAVAFDQVDPLAFRKADYVNEALCDRLGALSRQRRTESERFQKELRKIARYLDQKDRKTVSLNEKKFLAEWAEVDAENEGLKKMEEDNDKADGEIKKDYYLEEALAITLDYIQMTDLAQTN